MASSRTTVVVAVLLFLVCTLGEARKKGAGRTMLRGEVMVGNGGGGDNAPPHGFVGHRPRLVASFRRRDQEVGAPSSQATAGVEGGKREVPGGPDPIHHHPGGSMSPSSVSPP
jgi:hypothetical protein